VRAARQTILKILRHLLRPKARSEDSLDPTTFAYVISSKEIA
jgi:hypothetical protein